MTATYLASGLCLLFAISGALDAQNPTRIADTPNLPSQPIGANDLIAVSVYGSPELTRTVRVGPDGQIRLPMLKRRIKADGLLPVDLELAITEALTSERILVEPYVTITMAEYNSRPISIAGAVKKPTTFQAVGPMTLLEAVARAEGLRDDAGQEILVSRTEPGADGKAVSLTRRIPVKGLIDAADPELNLKLTGGEEIRVPEAGKIYVVGNVKKPGAFPVQETAETTVLQALALAEGVLPYAFKQAFIYRREGNGSKNEIPIELEKIIKRQAPDAPLLANDILYIPDNKNRRVAMQTVERIMSFGAGTASGVLIYRR
jgi:polysaccharide export outer membrane protein